jgi:hypothetical protein
VTAPAACRIAVTGLSPEPVSVGDMQRIGAIISSFAPEEVDPDTVRFKWKVNSDGDETTWEYGTDDELVKVDTGIYHAELPFNESGVYYMRWEVEGTFQGAVETTQVVFPSNFS